MNNILGKLILLCLLALVSSEVISTEKHAVRNIPIVTLLDLQKNTPNDYFHLQLTSKDTSSSIIIQSDCVDNDGKKIFVHKVDEHDGNSFRKADGATISPCFFLGFYENAITATQLTIRTSTEPVVIDFSTPFPVTDSSFNLRTVDFDQSLDSLPRNQFIGLHFTIPETLKARTSKTIAFEVTVPPTVKFEMKPEVQVMDEKTNKVSTVGIATYRGDVFYVSLTGDHDHFILNVLFDSAFHHQVLTFSAPTVAYIGFTTPISVIDTDSVLVSLSSPHPRFYAKNKHPVEVKFSTVNEKGVLKLDKATYKLHLDTEKSVNIVSVDEHCYQEVYSEEKEDLSLIGDLSVIGVDSDSLSFSKPTLGKKLSVGKVVRSVSIISGITHTTLTISNLDSKAIVDNTLSCLFHVEVGAVDHTGISGVDGFNNIVFSRLDAYKTESDHKQYPDHDVVLQASPFVVKPYGISIDHYIHKIDEVSTSTLHFALTSAYNDQILAFKGFSCADIIEKHLYRDTGLICTDSQDKAYMIINLDNAIFNYEYVGFTVVTQTPPETVTVYDYSSVKNADGSKIQEFFDVLTSITLTSLDVSPPLVDLQMYFTLIKDTEVDNLPKNPVYSTKDPFYLEVLLKNTKVENHLVLDYSSLSPNLRLKVDEGVFEADNNSKYRLRAIDQRLVLSRDSETHSEGGKLYFKLHAVDTLPMTFPSIITEQNIPVQLAGIDLIPVPLPSRGDDPKIAPVPFATFPTFFTSHQRPHLSANIAKIDTATKTATVLLYASQFAAVTFSNIASMTFADGSLVYNIRDSVCSIDATLNHLECTINDKDIVLDAIALFPISVVYNDIASPITLVANSNTFNIRQDLDLTPVSPINSDKPDFKISKNIETKVEFKLPFMNIKSGDHFTIDQSNYDDFLHLNAAVKDSQNVAVGIGMASLYNTFNITFFKDVSIDDDGKHTTLNLIFTAISNTPHDGLAHLKISHVSNSKILNTGTFVLPITSEGSLKIFNIPSPRFYTTKVALSFSPHVPLEEEGIYTITGITTPNTLELKCKDATSTLVSQKPLTYSVSKATDLCLLSFKENVEYSEPFTVTLKAAKSDKVVASLALFIIVLSIPEFHLKAVPIAAPNKNDVFTSDLIATPFSVHIPTTDISVYPVFELTLKNVDFMWTDAPLYCYTAPDRAVALPYSSKFYSVDPNNQGASLMRIVFLEHLESYFVTPYCVSSIIPKKSVKEYQDPRVFIQTLAMRQIPSPKSDSLTVNNFLPESHSVFALNEYGPETTLPKSDMKLDYLYPPVVGHPNGLFITLINHSINTDSKLYVIFNSPIFENGYTYQDSFVSVSIADDRMAVKFLTAMPGSVDGIPIRIPCGRIVTELQAISISLIYEYDGSTHGHFATLPNSILYQLSVNGEIDEDDVSSGGGVAIADNTLLNADVDGKMTLKLAHNMYLDRLVTINDRFGYVSSMTSKCPIRHHVHLKQHLYKILISPNTECLVDLTLKTRLASFGQRMSISSDNIHTFLPQYSNAPPTIDSFTVEAVTTDPKDPKTSDTSLLGTSIHVKSPILLSTDSVSVSDTLCPSHPSFITLSSISSSDGVVTAKYDPDTETYHYDGKEKFDPFYSTFSIFYNGFPSTEEETKVTLKIGEVSKVLEFKEIRGNVDFSRSAFSPLGSFAVGGIFQLNVVIPREGGVKIKIVTRDTRIGAVKDCYFTRHSHSLGQVKTTVTDTGAVLSFDTAQVKGKTEGVVRTSITCNYKYSTEPVNTLDDPVIEVYTVPKKVDSNSILIDSASIAIPAVGVLPVILTTHTLQFKTAFTPENRLLYSRAYTEALADMYDITALDVTISTKTVNGDNQASITFSSEKTPITQLHVLSVFPLVSAQLKQIGEFSQVSLYQSEVVKDCVNRCGLGCAPCKHQEKCLINHDCASLECKQNICHGDTPPDNGNGNNILKIVIIILVVVAVIGGVLFGLFMWRKRKIAQNRADLHQGLLDSNIDSLVN